MTTNIDFYTPFRATGYVTSGAAAELDEIANQLVDAADAAPPQGEDAEAEALRLLCDLAQDIHQKLPDIGDRLAEEVVRVLCQAYRQRVRRKVGLDAAFAKEMKDCNYGEEETRDAKAWFTLGYNAK